MHKSASGCRFEIVAPDHEHWDAYVSQHPHGTIFHTSAMIRVFSATCDLQPFAHAAIDAAGAIVAMVVSVHVKTLRGFSSLSSRAIQYAEPLCNDDADGVSALKQLVVMHDDYMCSKALFSEIRSIAEPGKEKQALVQCGYQHCDYVNYVVELDSDVERLWRNVDKRMRQKINSTLRKNIEIRDDTSPEGIDRLYDLLKYSYGRASVPLADRNLFEATLEHLPAGVVRIRTAFDSEKPVASIISLVYGGRVFSWYGGTLRLNGRSPFACIVWDDIVWGHNNGQSLFDFGGAGWPNEDYGPRRFKASFGGKEVRYGRYRATYSKLRLRIAEFAYGVSQKVGTWSASTEI